jgi:UDP-GlcNAc:undecaprenyl-phosphate/decaprenyl-phosphate GlcNAc-1-phosphate transferase
VNSAFLAAPLAAFVVLVLTPLVKRLAFRVGAVSYPGGRHIHQRAVPRLGGLAIALAFFTGVLVLTRTSAAVAAAFNGYGLWLVGILGGGAAMCLLGLMDDTRGIKATHKLAVQVAVAFFAYQCGLRIDAVYIPFVGDLGMGWLALPATLLWIVGVVNAVNLIDGLDGLAAGVVLFAAGTNLFVAFRGGAVVVVLLSAATAGAAFGFLFHNFNPARIFMGDSGSYFLGYVLAVTALLSHKASTAVSILVPLVALGVPIVDTLFAMVRRILERRSVFSPDRGHIHHRLLDMGITHRRAVLIIYGFCVACTMLAIGLWIERSLELAGFMLVALIVLAGLVRFTGSVGTSLTLSRQKQRLRSRDIEMLRGAIPAVPAAFERARTEDELFEALTDFAAHAEIGSVEAFSLEFREVGEPLRTPAFRWAKAPDSSKRDMVTARYPIGRDSSACAELEFSWMSEDGDVNAQSDILLQVVTDVLEANLTRLRSRLAPRVEPLSSPPAPALVPLPAPPDRAWMRRTG